MYGFVGEFGEGVGGVGGWAGLVQFEPGIVWMVGEGVLDGWVGV